jgi:peptide/nickel transport system substrate-binding protein
MMNHDDFEQTTPGGRLDRRSFLKRVGGATVGMAVLSAALGGYPSLTFAGQQDSSGAAQNASASQLAVVYESEPTLLDPHAFGSKGDDAIRMSCVNQLIRRQLTTGPYDNTQINTDQFEGALAQSWKNDTANGKVVFTLKPGIKFASGNPVTSADVKWSFDRSMQSPTSYVGTLMNMLTITTPDQIVTPADDTVELHYTQFNPFIWDLLSITVTAVLDSQTYMANATLDDQWATKWAANNIAGTGPYVVQDWEHGVQLSLTPNANYWESGYPKNQQVIVKVVPDPSNRLLVLESGDVDIVRGLNYKDLSSLQSAPGVKLLTYPTTEIWWMGLNTKVKPFDDKRVRQAMAYAFPYQDIVQNVWYGYADPMTSFVPQGMPTHDDSAWVYTTDIGKAKSLLADAGYPDGFDTRLIVNPANVEDSGSAVWIQSGLAKAGIRVTIDKQNEAAYNAALFTSRDAPLFLFNWISYVNDPFYHAYFLLKSDAGTNFSNWNNPQVDGLIMSGMYEGDAAKREGISKQIQSIAADEVPWVYMAQPKLALGMRDNVQGYAHFFDEIMRFWYLYKA